MNAVAHVVTAQEMLQTGLEMIYTKARIQQVKNHQTNITRFKTSYGLEPITAATVYEDLQKTSIAEAKIDNPSKITLKFFLISLFLLHPLFNNTEN